MKVYMARKSGDNATRINYSSTDLYRFVEDVCELADGGRWFAVGFDTPKQYYEMVPNWANFYQWFTLNITPLLPEACSLDIILPIWSGEESVKVEESAPADDFDEEPPVEVVEEPLEKWYTK